MTFPNIFRSKSQWTRNLDAAVHSASSDDGENFDESNDRQDDEIEFSEENYSDHRLTSDIEGSSEVEQLAQRIELRRKQRLPITSSVRTRMIQDCHSIQQENSYPRSKISADALIEYRNQIQTLVKSEENDFHLNHYFTGKPTPNELLLKVLNKAVSNVQAEGDEWFHYVDFQVYYTTSESEWSMLKHPIVMSLIWILSFYLLTPVFFCLIVGDEGVCEADDEGQYSWMSSIYFASATLSTVGYGDLHVSKGSDWYAFAGIFYMIMANVTLFCAFSSGQELDFESPLTKLNQFLIELVMGGRQNSEDLYSSIRRLKMVRIGQIALTFIFLNFVGALVAKIVTDRSDQDATMSWVASLYWAVQTTTTIGYGDLDTPFSLRWFQIFYLILSTYFVGQTLGGLSSLKRELEEVRTMTVWSRRELSKGLIDEMQPENHDNKVDQYEFVVASLVTLGKVSSQDIIPIMNKYRELANQHGFISYIDPHEEASGKSVPEKETSIPPNKSDSASESQNNDRNSTIEQTRGAFVDGAIEHQQKGSSDAARLSGSESQAQESFHETKTDVPNGADDATAKEEKGSGLSFLWFNHKPTESSPSCSPGSQNNSVGTAQRSGREEVSGRVYPEDTGRAFLGPKTENDSANVKARLAWLEQALFSEAEREAGRDDGVEFDVESGDTNRHYG